jgi:centromere protein J
MEKFYKQKEEDIIAFEQEKLEHARQMAKEKEELDAKLRSIDGGMKEELEVLRKENKKLKEEMKAKDQAHFNSLDKMKKEMNKVLKTNEELQKKITEVVGQKKLQNTIPKTNTQTRIKTPDAKSGVKNMLGSRSSKVDAKLHSKTITDTSAKKKDLNKSPSNSRTNIKTTSSSLAGDKKIATPNKNTARNQPESAEKVFNNTFKCNDEVYDMVFPPKYHSSNNGKILSSKSSQEGKVTKVYSNGKTEMLFANGVKRESFADGYTIIYFNNKDIKQTYPNGQVVYYFAEAKTTQTTFPDGLQVFKFPNNQLEKHYADGHKEIA